MKFLESLFPAIFLTIPCFDTRYSLNERKTLLGNVRISLVLDVKLSQL